MKRSTLSRRTPMRRAPMKSGKRKSRYARRDRDTAFMAFVKSQPCSVTEDWPAFPVGPTQCAGVVEADHMGMRGLSRKASDDTCAALCTQHHRERTDHTGTFKHMTREQCRVWRDRQILRTKTLYAESRGLEVA